MSHRFSVIEHHPVFGGAQNRTLRLAPKLLEQGWHTLAIVPSESNTSQTRLRDGGVDVAAIPLHRLRRGPSHFIPLVLHLSSEIKEIRKLIRTNNLELMVVVGVENPHGAIAARLENIPIVWQINATQTPMFVRRAMIPVIRRLADVVMTTGTKIVQEYPGLVDALGQRWVPFYSPVDVDVFAPSIHMRAQARKELGLAPDAIVIGTIGNRNPQKGHDIFVRAAARLSKERPNLQFVILGARDENHGSRDDEILREARQLGLIKDKNLFVVDPGKQVAKLAAAFDIFWFSSVPKSEGVPTAIMEAMALGLPVVATDVGGTTDVVQDGETGFVVPPLDPASLASASISLIDSAALRASMGEVARERAVLEFRTERCVDAHLSAFRIAQGRSADSNFGTL
jgi:glycosyltransferase involved in cell wall biosynthesis